MQHDGSIQDYITGSLQSKTTRPTSMAVWSTTLVCHVSWTPPHWFVTWYALCSPQLILPLKSHTLRCLVLCKTVKAVCIVSSHHWTIEMAYIALSWALQDHDNDMYCIIRTVDDATIEIACIVLPCAVRDYYSGMYCIVLIVEKCWLSCFFFPSGACHNSGEFDCSTALTRTWKECVSGPVYNKQYNGLHRGE